MTKTKLNYDFAIRDIEQTKKNHYKRILKLTKDKMTLVHMIEQLEENNEGEVYNTSFSRNYTYAYDRLTSFREEKKQSDLNTIKVYVNDATISHIRYLLKRNELPKSYFTAFYCIFYARINRLMKRNLKAIV